MKHFLTRTPFSSAPFAPAGIIHVIDKYRQNTAAVSADDMLRKLDSEGLALLRRSDHKLRRAGKPRFLCGFCQDPVHIRVTSVAASGHSGGRRAAFVHDPRREPRDCPFGHFAHHNSPAMIDGARFAGRQEGARHLFLKTRLCQMLKSDPRIIRADCEALVAGAAADGSTTWRRPDVLAMTEDGRRLAFDVQLASPLIATIDGRERFYSAQQIAWHWVVDTDQPSHLQLQGFQDLIMPQACRVLGFDEEIAHFAKKDNQSRFHLLHVKETQDHRCLEATCKVIGLETAFRLAGFPKDGPPPFATDLRALGLFMALYRGNETRAAGIFDLLSAGCGTPNWADAQSDHVPAIISTIATLVMGQKADATGFAKDAVNAITNNFLRPDLRGQRSNLAKRSWAEVIAELTYAEPDVYDRINRPGTKTRALLEAALAEITADPTQSRRLRMVWAPLMRRLFPRLTL